MKTKEKDVAETVLTIIGFTAGILEVSLVTFLWLINNGMIDPTKW
jgi:hypothetical protein